ncbi:venom serine carboxypeptidase [Diabrotica virgifera virgifera]|uniref:Carboxypeptidase n=1 Tax=Diabrotica virgifera virgifera TaxID=50390 RepID=A0A6P7EZH8_DIAVI|nr:venom serine carboxypeptidase [Diabrotica virgifera virgifera]
MAFTCFTKTIRMKVLLSISFRIFLLSLAETSAVHDFFQNNLFYNYYGKLDGNLRKGDAGKPLILTDLIKTGRLHEAQNRARVTGLNTDVVSYAGYLTVDEIYKSNLFFWFFPSEGNYKVDPVLLWLQGGPGSSSLFGLFTENGPFYVTEAGELSKRNTSWTMQHSVLYIDQPAGTGFSFTDGGYAQNQTKVASDLYEALYQFFTLFYEFQDREFFIAGESYAGKYIPAIGYEIHHRNPAAKLKINLKGLAIGNGYTDPINQFRFSDYVYQHGLIDLNVKNLLQDLEDEGINAIQSKNYSYAYHIQGLIWGTIIGESSINWYNYIDDKTFHEAAENTPLDKFLRKQEVRRAIHVGNTKFDDTKVSENLLIDMIQSEAQKVSELLSYYRVLIYNGQLDIMVPYPLTVNYLQKLKFSGSDIYKKAKRRQWRDDNNKDVVAGYVKTAGNLTEIMVRNAGHMVPTDQPEWALQLINKFTRNKRFD